MKKKKVSVILSAWILLLSLNFYLYSKEKKKKRDQFFQGFYYRSVGKKRG
jgi:hypothetical protein